MMRDVGAIFPNLKEVEFVGRVPCDGSFYYAHSETLIHSSLADDEVGLILEKWQNVCI